MKTNLDNNETVGWFIQVWNGAKQLVGVAARQIPSCAAAAAIALPILAISALPSADGAEFTAGNSSMTIPASTEIGFPQTVANFTFAGLHLLGALGAAGHILRNESPIELDEFKKPIDIDDLEEDAPESQMTAEPLPQIYDQSDFSDVAPGSVALSAKQTHYTSVVIAKGQEFMGVQEIWQNVTHAGIVTKKINDIELAVQEIPDATSRLSENLYHRDAMSAHEQMLFFNFADSLPPEEKDSFHRHFSNVASAFIKRLEDKPKQNYNYRSIAKIPFASPKFEARDWDSLLNDLMEYRALSADPSYVPKHKQYFCSEFVLNCAQLARLMQKYPEVVALIDAALETSHERERQTVIHAIRRELDEKGILAELTTDLFFFTPAAKAIPASLMEFAVRHHLPISRVSNPNPAPQQLGVEETVSLLMSRRLLQHPISSSSSASRQCKSIEGIDYHLDLLERKWRDEETIDQEDSSLLCLTEYLLRQDEFAGYSKPTLQCIIASCFRESMEQMPSCVGSCIEQTFTWREKIKLLLTSIAVDHTLDRVIENGQMGKLLDSLLTDPNPDLLNVNKLINFLFDMNDFSLFDTDQIENYIINVYANKFMNDSDLFKYGPLGVLGMEDILEQIGWEVASPIDRIRDFAFQHFANRDKGELVMQIIQATVSRALPLGNLPETTNAIV